MTKRILPLFLLLTSCATQPSVESVKAADAAREGKCEQQGYKRGTRDFHTCVQLAAQQEITLTPNVGTTMAMGGGLAALGLISALK